MQYENDIIRKKKFKLWCETKFELKIRINRTKYKILNWLVFDMNKGNLNK